MKKLTRLFVFIIVLILILPYALSCNRKNANSSSELASGTAEVTNNTVDTTNKYKIESDIPYDLDFGGKEIRILSLNKPGSDDEIMPDMDKSSTLVYTALVRRNAETEQRIGVKIVNELIPAPGNGYLAGTDKIRTLVNAQIDEIDIIFNPAIGSFRFMVEGLFHNVNQFDYLDLDKDCWSQGFNEAVSYGDKQYLITGAPALTLFRYMFVTMFNKNLQASHDIENLYDVVNRGEWTLEYQYNLTRNIYTDFNNNDRDKEDLYGFVTGRVTYIDPYWSACDLNLIGKTESNRYNLVMDIGKISSAADKIINLFYSSGAYVYPSTSDSETQKHIASHFAEGRALMVTLRMYAVEDSLLKNMGDKFGILPMPKFDAVQENYKTYMHDQFSALSVVSTVPNSKGPMMGAFLQVFAEKSYEIVVPAFYETALKYSYLRDGVDAEMLETIYKGAFVDAGVLIHEKLTSPYILSHMRTIVDARENTVSSIFAGFNTALLPNLTKFMQDLDKVS